MKKNFIPASIVLVIALVSNCLFAQTQPAKKPTPKATSGQSKTKPKSATPASTPGPVQPKKETVQSAGGVQEATSTSPEKEKGMSAWMEYMTPGTMHEMLAKCDGEWNESITFWMTPGAPPTKSNAKCTNKMIMGNRYQESIHTSEMNGMPFEGRGIVGFDNAKKVFVSTWIDNMGTGMMYLEGSWDETKGTIFFKGKAVDPMTGKEKDVREEFKIIDSNNQQMEMYMTQNGQEFKNMEIRFTR